MNGHHLQHVLKLTNPKPIIIGRLHTVTTGIPCHLSLTSSHKQQHNTQSSFSLVINPCTGVDTTSTIKYLTPRWKFENWSAYTTDSPVLDPLIMVVGIDIQKSQLHHQQPPFLFPFSIKKSKRIQWIDHPWCLCIHLTLVVAIGSIPSSL
jgi:hypothetical protein